MHLDRLLIWRSSFWAVIVFSVRIWRVYFTFLENPLARRLFGNERSIYSFELSSWDRPCARSTRDLHTDSCWNIRDPLLLIGFYLRWFEDLLEDFWLVFQVLPVLCVFRASPVWVSLGARMLKFGLQRMMEVVSSWIHNRYFVETIDLRPQINALSLVCLLGQHWWPSWLLLREIVPGWLEIIVHLGNLIFLNWNQVGMAS